jgi:hypothetical protein
MQQPLSGTLGGQGIKTFAITVQLLAYSHPAAVLTIGDAAQVDHLACNGIAFRSQKEIHHVGHIFKCA